MELTLSPNKKFLIIDSCTEIEYEQLKISLTKKIEGWRFHPLVTNTLLIYLWLKEYIIKRVLYGNLQNYK